MSGWRVGSGRREPAEKEEERPVLGIRREQSLELEPMEPRVTEAGTRGVGQREAPEFGGAGGRSSIHSACGPDFEMRQMGV